MEQVFYCRVRDQVLKIFRIRKYLIRQEKDKKGITLYEVECLEQKFTVVFSDLAAAKFIVQYFDTLVWFGLFNQTMAYFLITLMIYCITLMKL